MVVTSWGGAPRSVAKAAAVERGVGPVAHPLVVNKATVPKINVNMEDFTGLNSLVFICGERQ
jgi:hypothetical protein